MKFIAKNSNLRVVLTPSIQAEPLAGRAAIRGLFVKFEDGVANVVDNEIIDLMLKHPAFNVDYICAEEGTRDPYIRRSVEPEHNVVNIEYGHVGKNVNPATAMTGLTPELKKVLSDMAKSMAQQMTEAALAELAPKLTAQIIEGMKKEAAPAVSATSTWIGDPAHLTSSTFSNLPGFNASDTPIPPPNAPKKMGRPPKVKS